MGQASIIPTIDNCEPVTPTVLTSKFDGSTEPSIQSTPSEDSMQGSGDQLPPQVREVVVRSTAVNTAGYSLVVPVRVKGKTLEGVVDTGADGTVINSKFIDITQFEAEPVMLKGLEPDRLIAGHLIKDVAINLGGRMYRWDLYVAPISDDLLLGLDFMIAYKVDPLISRNVLMIGGLEVPATLKRGSSGQQQGIGRVLISKRTVVPPNSVMRMECNVDRAYDGSTCLVSPGLGKRGLAIPYAAVNVREGKVVTQVANVSDHFVTLKEGFAIGSIEEIEEVIEDGKMEDTVPNVRTCTEHTSQGASTSEGTGEESTSSSGDITKPKSAGEDDPILESIFEKLPFRTSEEVKDHMPAHMIDMFEKSCGNLTEEQSIIFGNLLIDFQNIFAKDDTDLGCFVGVEHKIDTGDAKPIKQPMRRVPLAFTGEEEKHLQKMLDYKVIQPSASEWSSPSVLIRKRDGDIRWCIDFRAINQVTRKDAYPLPLIEQCLDALAGIVFMSTLDMNSGYWQLLLAIADRCKTAFQTKDGLFEFLRMPFGLCNAPATFQRAIQLVFRGMTWREVLTYLDDINVLGRGFEDHLQNLRKAFERLQENNLKLKPKKCKFFQTEVPFLGKLATQKGLAVDPKKVEAVVSWPVPTCRKEVESFLGFVNYHRNHIKDYAQLAAPLYDITGKKEFHWDEPQQSAFEALREALVCAPVLAYPNADDPFILDTDASGTAIGAELIQVQGGEERVIAYGSFSLTPAQRKYCTTKLELLALVRFTREYRHYLLGRKFVVRTDHSSLTWLMQFRHVEGMLARWLEELSQYDMVIQHRKGVHHGNADPLSRRPDDVKYCDCYEAGVTLESLPCGGCKFCTCLHNQWARFEDDVDDVVPLAIRRVTLEDEDVDWDNILSTDFPSSEESTAWLPRYTPEELRQAQLNDPGLAKLIDWLESGKSPALADLYLCSPAVKKFWLCKSQLEFVNGVLRYRWEDNPEKWLFVVPDSMQEEVMTGCHDCPTAGHLGQKKTLDRVKLSFIWHELSTDVGIYVRSCPICNKNKKSNVKPRARLGSFRAGAPMERVHMDILGPFPPSESGNRYILLMIDQFTKWVEIHAIPDQTAVRTARIAVDNFFSRFGAPLQIHTDQGKNFDGHVMKALCSLYRITKTRTTPYHPSSNGQAERYNRLLLQLIRCFRRAREKTWDEDLQLLAGAIRSMKNRATGFSANMLMLGHEVTQPIDVLFGAALKQENCNDPGPYLKHLRETLREIHNLASSKLRSQMQYQKRTYDLKLQEHHYDVGDFVFRRRDASKLAAVKN